MSLSVSPLPGHSDEISIFPSISYLPSHQLIYFYLAHQSNALLISFILMFWLLYYNIKVLSMVSLLSAVLITATLVLCILLHGSLHFCPLYHMCSFLPPHGWQQPEATQQLFPLSWVLDENPRWPMRKMQHRGQILCFEPTETESCLSL